MEFGAFVNFLGKQDGLVHITSELADKRVAKVADVVKEGDEVSVKVVGFDTEKVKLIKQLNNLISLELGHDVKKFKLSIYCISLKLID